MHASARTAVSLSGNGCFVFLEPSMSRDGVTTTVRRSVSLSRNHACASFSAVSHNCTYFLALLFPALYTLLLFSIAVHTYTSAAAAGPEQAVHWLAEHEHDFDGDSAPSPQPLATGISPVPSVRLQGAGVAGILRREAQLAARNDE